MADQSKASEPEPIDAQAEAKRLVEGLPDSWPREMSYRFKAAQTEQCKALLAAHPSVRKAAVFLVIDLTARASAIPRNPTSPLARVSQFIGRMFPSTDDSRGYYHHIRTYGRDTLAALLRAKLPFTPQEAEQLFAWLAGSEKFSSWAYPIASILNLAEDLAQAGQLTEQSKKHLTALRDLLAGGYNSADTRRMIGRIDAMLNASASATLAPGDPWTDRALADIASEAPPAQAAWAKLIQHCVTAGASGKPSATWEKQAAEMLKAIGPDNFTARMIQWFALVDKPRADARPIEMANRPHGNPMRISDYNVDVLRGFVWSCALCPETPEGCRALGHLCESTLKKIPGVGPRAPKVANAVAWTLGRLGGEHAIGQLSRLKTRVRFKTTLAQIEKALDEAAARQGMTRNDLEELGVPTYGFDSTGTRRQTFDGAGAVELKIVGRDVVTTWTNDKEKPVKSPPASIKSNHAAALKDLKSAAADAEKMLTAQRDRIDSMMALPRTWKLADFRSRYLDHPLVGSLARRLIWIIDGVPVLFIDGRPTDVAGNAIEVGQTAEVSLWHPATRTTDEIVAWRTRLEQLRITQPFKQAHREVYLLTDAERNTHTYSNRFAAHILRQHQFNALCAARGWRNKLRLMVDDTYPPASKDLPAFGLRAEFWIEGIGGDFGTDTNEAGVYLRLTTDQVRFYRSGAAVNFAHAGGGGYTASAAGPGEGNLNEPLPLEQIPPLAFTEIMRDVDLFVGVASVGNDPTWQDGGGNARYQEYWNRYSFGDLNESAKTRKAVLDRLLPRLKIAPLCTLSEKFLIVKGRLRTYKIHLGSGNILMEPNDQYLCIVPDRRANSAAQSNDVFLPFEGDSVLSLVLSKAFLLAADDKITDSTITRQIKPP